MTKDVILSVSGLQMEVGTDEDNEAIEMISPAQYFLKNGKHYILYQERTEGYAQATKTQIKITSDSLIEVRKSGVTNVHMTFAKGQKKLANYGTPFGQVIIGTDTKGIKIETGEDDMNVKIDYNLDINHEFLAECQICMNIKSKGTGSFAIKEKQTW